MITLRFVPRAFAALLLVLVGTFAATAALAQKVRMSTTLGDIVLELDSAKAPKTVANFVQYVQSKHYDGTVFHRVIDGFMIQGGGMTPDMQQKATRAPVALESGNGLSNVRGAIAMARTMDPNSATAQFFINVQDNRMLDPAGTPDGYGYTVFGKVIQGMDVVDKIKSVRTGRSGMHRDVPVEPVIIRKASLE